MKQAVRTTLALICSVVMALAASAASHAVDLNILLVDELDNPVAGAVVELDIENTDSMGKQATIPDAIIDQIDRRFVPDVLLIDVGQYVHFPNSDNVRHHVYSFSDIKQFSTPLYADESIEPVLFDKPGIAVLGCNIHDSMVAYVYVSESYYRAISDEKGNLALSGLPANPGSITVWHPRLQTPDNRFKIDVSAVTEDGPLQIRIPVRPPETRFGFRALLPEI